MLERAQFIGEYEEEELTMAELCRAFGISRPTGYKWIQRYLESGAEGLRDQTRAPRSHPNQVSQATEGAITGLRAAHPSWGPLKLLARLAQEHPHQDWPSASTIGGILKRRGLSIPRHRRRTSPAYSQPFQNCEQSNAVWSADFKGWFLTGDGSRCDPFTLSDNYSRYLLRCQAVNALDGQTLRPIFEAAFREYGLPIAIRTDNGAPFATTTVGGLSRLSIWWLRLGIMPERIAPGKPAQNGRHERMHRTLKAETAQPPQRTLRNQQRTFDAFRQEYNNERPHQALQQQSPASVYRHSERPFPIRLPQIDYPEHFATRKVHPQGDLCWNYHQIYLSSTLADEYVGFDQVDDHLWQIYFGPIHLAFLDDRNHRLIHRKQSRQKTTTHE